MLCYGFVALYSPPSLIISRMEATILRSLTPHFANVKVNKMIFLFNVEALILFIMTQVNGYFKRFIEALDLIHARLFF